MPEVILKVNQPGLLIECQEIPIRGFHMTVKVAPGYEAFVVEKFDPNSSDNDYVTPDNPITYKSGELGKKVFHAVVYQSNTYSVSVPIYVYGETYDFRIKEWDQITAPFPLVGQVNVEIRRTRDVAKHVQRNMTMEDVKELIKSTGKNMIASSLKATADKFFNKDMNISDTSAFLNKVRDEAFGDSSIRTLLNRLGVYLIPSNSKIYFNTTEETEALIKRVKDKKNAIGEGKIEAEEKMEQRKLDQEDAQIEHEHKVEEIRADNTRISEHYTNHKENPHAPKEVKVEKRFCGACGKQIKPSLAYCPYCGAKQ